MDGLDRPSFSLAALSAFTTRGNGRLMAALKAYYDDSGEEADPQHKACALFGYVTEPENWDKFEDCWSAALAKAEVPYLHMREFNVRSPPFDKMSEASRETLLTDCAQVARDCAMVGLGSIIRLTDLRRFNAKHGVEVNDYALNLYSSIVSLAHHFPDDHIEMFLDRAAQRKMHKIVGLAEAYVATDPIWKDKCDKVAPFVLSKAQNFQNIRPLQAADYVAWESRKDVTTKDGWFDEYRGARHTKEAQANLQEWVRRSGHDGDTTYVRPSMNALVATGQVAAPVWDYQTLCLLHELRNGVWPSA